MSCRVHLPEGHNHVVARYPRTLREAFLCDAREAIALHGAPTRRTSAWARLAWAACAVALALPLITGLAR